MTLRLIAVFALIAPSAGAYDPWQDTARFELEYRVDLSTLRFEPGAHVRLWIPAPLSEPSQRVLAREIDSPWEHRIETDARGNELIYVTSSEPTDEPIRVRVRVLRSPSTGTPADAVQPATRDDPQRFLAPAQRIPLDGVIREIAEEQSAGLTSDAEKIRAFYDYVVSTMRYSKEGEGWGRGDAVWACSAKYGNCTDFHSLFIGMARSQGIPARFVMGFPITPSSDEGEVGGYHCWTEVFDRERGWLPLDASEARKSGLRDEYFGRLPSDRAAFTIGRDLTLAPEQAGGPLNYLIYPYAEIDGRPVAKVGWKLSFKRLPAEVAQR